MFSPIDRGAEPSYNPATLVILGNREAGWGKGVCTSVSSGGPEKNDIQEQLTP
jgi:hypothetical protein